MSAQQHDRSLSRREVLRHGVIAAAGGAAVLGRGTAFGQAPAIQTHTQTGRRFRAFVSPPGGRPRGIETVTLRAIQPHQVVIRTEAAQACYTIVNLLAPPVVAPAAAAANGPPSAPIAGHGCVGIVEAIGSAVRRVPSNDLRKEPLTIDTVFPY